MPPGQVERKILSLPAEEETKSTSKTIFRWSDLNGNVLHAVRQTLMLSGEIILKKTDKI